MSRECPSPAVLEAAAEDPSAEAEVRAHLAGCEACRVALEEIRANNRFLPGARLAYVAMKKEPGGPALEAVGPAAPDLFPGYEIRDEIHRGGQGIVYRAVQVQTQRTVAIKMLLGGMLASSRQRERFEREVRTAASLRHPNIVTIYDSGAIADGRYGLVMEFIEGRPLDEWSRSLERYRGREARRQALRQRLELMVKVCDAVLCAHQHSIVHRDLKPANILVDSADEPHILDFGIARNTGPEERSRLTNTGEFAGTLAYASPEQVSGDLSKVDTRTDIYSLGVIMYEMVSGGMPYPMDGAFGSIIRSIESAEPSPLPRRTRNLDGPWVDEDVSTIILKALAKDPARRYQTVAGLRSDISRYLNGEAVEARRDSTWYVIRKTAAKHRVVVAAAGLIIVLLAGFGAAMGWQAHRLEVRGGELAGALSGSNVERGRSLAAAGSIAAAQDAVWPELARAGLTQIDGPGAGFTGSPAALQAYWALWDIFRQSRCIAAVTPSDSPSLDLVYFDEGDQRLNAFSYDGMLTSWSVATWERVREVALVAPVNGVALHAALGPGGRIAVFGGGVLRVIDPRTARVEAQADDPDAQAVTGAFSPDGSFLATIGRDNRLRVRDARSLETVLTIPESTVCEFHEGQFCKPAFSPDGALIAAALPEGSLGLWSATSGVLVRALPPPASLDYYVRIGMVPSRIAFGPDGTIAASLGPHLLAWRAGGTNPVDVGAQPGNIVAVGFLAGSGGRIVFANGLGVTSLWDLETGRREAMFAGDAGFSQACAASDNGRQIAAADRFVRVYEIAPDSHVTVLHSGGGPGSVAALSPDGRQVALATGPGDLRGQDVILIDRHTGATATLCHRDGARIVCLEFAPDGLSLFEAETSGRVTQWNLDDGTIRHEFSSPDPAASSAVGRRREPTGDGIIMGENMMRLSADGGILAGARTDSGIDLWDVPSGRWIDRLASGSSRRDIIDMSPDGLLAAGSWAGSCVLWDIRSRQIVRTIGNDNNYFQAVRFSRDGRLLAFTARPATLRFYDVGTGRAVAENQVLGTAAMGMVFHPGGNVFFASAQDQSIRLWDTRTGRELLSLQKHAAPIVSLLVTPDGNTLISSDLSGTVLVWDLTYYNDRIRRELAYRASHTVGQ